MKKEKTRPYWYVDMKWLFGILFTLSLTILMLSCNLFMITKKENVEKVTNPILKQLILPEEFEESDFETIKYFAEKNPDSLIQIPNSVFQLGIMSSDIKDLNQEEFKDYLINQLVNQIYKGSVKSLTFSEENGEEQVQETPQILAWLMKIFNEKTNKFSEIVLYASIIACLIFILPFILFSHHFGKLISLGISAFIVSLPFVIGMLIGETSLKMFIKSGEEISGILGSDFWDIYNIVQRNYLYLFLAGIGSFFIAGIGKLISVIIRKKRKKDKIKTS